MEFLRDFWRFLMARKKYWLIPVILVVILLGLLLVLAENPATGGGFVYTFF